MDPIPRGMGTQEPLTRRKLPKFVRKLSLLISEEATGAPMGP